MSSYTSTGEEWHICSFNAQPEAPAFFVATPEQASASGWALNESLSTGSGIRFQTPWNSTAVTPASSAISGGDAQSG